MPASRLALRTAVVRRPILPLERGTLLAALGLALALCGSAPHARAGTSADGVATSRAAATESTAGAAGGPPLRAGDVAAGADSAGGALASSRAEAGVHGFRLEREDFVARTPATPVAEPSGVLVDA